MHSSAPDLILHSRRVVTPLGMRAAAIVVQSGKIVEVTTQPPAGNGFLIEELGDLVVMPGVIDAHVHVNEPGRTEWEGFASATRAAAAGGITALMDMPLNSTPVTTSTTALARKLAAAQGKLWVDCGFYAGLVPGSVEMLAPLLRAGVQGVKAFLVHSGIEDFPNVGEEDLRAALPLLVSRDFPLLVHAELQGELATPWREVRSYQAYLASRPPAWENEAIALMIKLCRAGACRVHIVHLSSASAVPMLQAARAAGLPLSVETCPHYLYFSAEEIADGDTRFKCAPPIRDHDNQELLWQALREGVIDFIASDHSPCPPALKQNETGDFQRAWGGIASLQFLLPVTWTAACARGFSIAELWEWLCHRPAKFLGLAQQKGVMAPGADADFVVWNPEAEFDVTPEIIHHRHKITPYAGRRLKGVVERTYLRGNMIYEQGGFVGAAQGQTLLRQQA